MVLVLVMEVMLVLVRDSDEGCDKVAGCNHDRLAAQTQSCRSGDGSSRAYSRHPCTPVRLLPP